MKNGLDFSPALESYKKEAFDHVCFSLSIPTLNKSSELGRQPWFRRSCPEEVLIFLDNYEKISDDSYSTLQDIVKYLIKETSFQILLTSSVHAAPYYFSKIPHFIFTIEPWTDQQRQLFASQRGIGERLILKSEFSLLLNNPRYLNLYCHQIIGLQSHNNDPIPTNLVYFLEKLELAQWLGYFKRTDTQKRKRDLKVPFDSHKLNTLSLATFRIMCETEFEFIKKQAQKSLSKKYAVN